MASVQSVLMQQGFAAASPTPLSSIMTASQQQQGGGSSILGVNGTDVFGIIDWIREQPGGIFNPKQELRLQVPNDPASRWMLYATDSMDEGEILSKIPWQSILMPRHYYDNHHDEDDEDNDAKFDLLEDLTGDLNCDTTRYLTQELGLGNSSQFGPYMQYLSALSKEGQSSQTIPSAWSTEGKEILEELLGGLVPDLPPGAPVDMIDDDWYTNCEGTEDGVVAASLILQHGLYDTFMVPTFDWYTHRNGDFYNIRTDLVEGQYFEITARRRIQAGEPLHNSYDLCDQCNEEAVDAGYGTPEIFRDYGVVEQYPQRWTFQPNAFVLETSDGGSALYAPEQITFELVPNDSMSGSSSIQVQWSDDIIFDDRGRNYVRRIFRQYLRKLYRFQNIHYDLLEDDEQEGGDKSVDSDSMPASEWKQIQAYYRALRSALQYGIHSLKNEGDETGAECREGIMSSNEGACESAHLDIYGIHYDDLLEEEDTVNYIFPSCQTTQLVEFHHYQTIEDLQTNYQKLWFMTREEDNDVCMNLENTLQICSNYRPHYHEFFVHFPARFIEKIERVIFIGGGDSMLLHEVLKYPSLQKVVGLELDQQVTRKSFQHFKSQPHWDNDKVEWWYGDATKSLPLLPRDYWGSFDLVLVDLSETVMSFSVTKTMDIFSALSLLLKPEGIMVKNEPYIDQFSDFFDHTIQIFYGTPKICTQVLVMGSNQVDFLHHPTKDHKVERLLLEPLDNFKSSRYKYMHDYRKTDARQQGKCNNDNDDNDDDEVNQEGSIEHGAKAGIVEILEADNVSYSFETEHLESTLFNVAKEQGLTPLSPPMVHAKGPISAMIMKEGYIVARAKPSHKYIAFDIHWWGAFSKMESLRAALLKAVGSETSSFYRVVAGGMHGTSTWEEDKNAIGIQILQTRNCQTKEWSETEAAATNGDLANVALKASLKEAIQFLPKKEIIIAVVLGGFESQGPSVSSQALSEIQGRKVAVEPIWACPDLANYTNEEASLDTFDQMFECEKMVLQQLTEVVAKHHDEDIDMFIIDPSAPRAMGQVFNSIWAILNNREALLADRNVFVAFSKTGEDNEWRKNALERYRKESHFFPISRAAVSMSAGTGQEYELHITAVDDRYFFQHLHDLESKIRSNLLQGKTKTAFQEVEAKRITGGMHYYDSEYDVRLFPPDSYDFQPALVQAANQEPIGRQGIFQFEWIMMDDDAESPSTSMPSIEKLNEDLQATILEALGLEANRIQRWSTFRDMGDGAVVLVIFSGGNLVMVWDGRTHMDLNLYTLDQSKAVADAFVDAFAKKTSLTKTLRDDQPRGPGRVVQFDYEISGSS